MILNEDSELEIQMNEIYKDIDGEKISINEDTNKYSVI